MGGSLSRIVLGLCAIALLAIGGCSFGPVSTEHPVFTKADLSAPAFLDGAYQIVDPEKNKAVYLRALDLGEAGRVLEIFSEDTHENAQPGTWTLIWFPIEVVALDGGYDAVHLTYEDRLRFFGEGTPLYTHGYWVVRDEGETLRILDIERVAPETRKRLAAGRALESGDSGTLSGALTPATLRGFLGDLRDQVVGAPAGDGERTDQLLTRIAAVPGDIETASYDFRAAFESLLPASAAINDPNRDIYLAYLANLTARGMPQGSYMLARLYANGWLVAKDYDRARQLAASAVASGYARANTVLGVLAFNGFGEPADTARGLTLLSAAADAGDARAMFVLADIYEAGTAVPRDEALALSWLQRAAAGELPEAQFKLGQRVMNGQGPALDDAALFKLFDEASKRDHVEATGYLGYLYASGRGTEADQEKASDLYLRAAKGGYVWAEWQIGERLIEGTGIEQDRDQGIEWLRQAAAAGSAGAQEALQRHQAR